MTTTTSQMQGELWGARAADWAEIAEPTTAPLWTAVLKAAGVAQGVRVLDMGCGGGGLACLAARLGANVTGIDASRNLIDIAKRRVPSGQFSVGDVVDLPYSSTSFDAVVSCNCIQFADNQVKAVQEARRVLKPDGAFVIGMWGEMDRNQMAPVFAAVMSVAPPPAPTPKGPPSLANRDNLAALLTAGGFRVAEEADVECVFEFKDVDQAWQGVRAAGMVEAAARAAGEDALMAAVLPVLTSFADEDGKVHMSNWFRYMVGR